MAQPPSPQPLKISGVILFAFAVLILVGLMVWVLEMNNLLSQVPLLLFYSIFTGILLLPVVSGRGRRKLAAWPAGRRWIAILAILVVATMNFTLLTGVLYQQGLLRLEGSNLSGSTIGARAFGFYFWHLLNAVPVLDITESLRWEAPYQFRDVWSGLLLIAFKVVVTTPIILALTIPRAARGSGEHRVGSSNS